MITPPSKNTPPLEFAIGGMHCAACSSRIERMVGGLPGVARISVSLASNTAQLVPVEGVNTQDLSSAVVSAVSNLGFSAQPYSTSPNGGSLSETAARWEQRREEQQQELSARKRELVPAFTFALPLLVLSMGEMAGIPLPASLAPKTAPLAFALLQLFLCLPVLWVGRRFFFQGIPALWRKSPNMDTLVAVGTGAAFIFSAWNTLALALPEQWHYHLAAAHTTMPTANSVPESSSGILNMLFGTGHAAYGAELYFESAAVVIALVSLGKYLEARSRMRTSEAMKGLLELAPETAIRILTEGSSTSFANAPREEVPLAAVRVNDVLLVRPGGRIPVDGTVLEGASFVDESMLTGESMPVEKNTESSVAGGSMNQQGVFIMRADRVGADTVLARIVRLVQEAQGSKAPIAGMADTVSLYFVPTVICLALLAGLGWWIFGDSPAFAVRIFVSVMVIACPCAMGLATPMSIMVGTGRGAQLGVLFKNGEALERTSHITTMVFDKTGTLTQGKPMLVATEHLVQSANAIMRDGDALLRIAASLEVHSEHPLARAVVEKAEEKSLSLWPVDNFQATPGKGIAGEVRTDSGIVYAAVGNAAFARAIAQRPPSTATPDLDAILTRDASEGKTPVILVIDGLPVAVFAIADPIRPEAKAMISALSRMKIDCVMLTGDNAITARAVAAKAGILHVTAEVLPEGKGAVIADLQEKGQVVGMVGDGVNDAPALARADVGFAMSNGIDVAVETGDVILMRHGLHGIPVALGLGRATMRNIRENLFWAFAYNVMGIPFAAGIVFLMGGPVLSPMLAGAAMALSSVSVVMNALRLRFFYEKKY